MPKRTFTNGLSTGLLLAAVFVNSQVHGARSSGSGSASGSGRSAAQALASLRTNGPQAEEKCDASDDAQIQAARAKASNLTSNQQGENAANPQQACAAMQDAANDAGKALQDFKTKCEPIVRTCRDDLAALANTTLDARSQSLKEKCEQAEEDLSKLEAELGKTKTQANASSQCQKDIGGSEMPKMPQMPTSSPSPSPSPTAKEAPQNCDNPTFAATNPVCACRANPFAVGCGTDASPSVDALINDSSQAVDSTPSSNSQASANSAAGGRAKSALGQFKGGGAGGGGGVSANSANPAGRDQTKASDGIAKIAASGIGGGAGGSGAAGGGGASPGAGGGYRDENKDGRRPGSLKNDAGAPDLNKFLPGKDGLTGPHTDLFRKVRIRYKAKADSLNP